MSAKEQTKEEKAVERARKVFERLEIVVKQSVVDSNAASERAFEAAERARRVETAAAEAVDIALRRHNTKEVLDIDFVRPFVEYARAFVDLAREVRKDAREIEAEAEEATKGVFRTITKRAKAENVLEESIEESKRGFLDP